jgi:hypothetical protein
MNPEILREIARQQVADQRARAHRDRVARTLVKALRGSRVAESDGFVAPVIPDYVDGTFQGAKARSTGLVQSARHAA